MFDLHTNINPVPLFVPGAAVVNNTAQVSAIIDIKGYNSAEFVIVTGALADADATFTVLVEDGDVSTLTDAAAVPDIALIGTEALAGFTFADDNKCFKIGYNGTKRYARVTITPANNTGNAYIAGVAILGNPGSAPTANPPA